MMKDTDIGDNIRHYRLRGNMTQTALARRVGVSRVTIFRYEHGLSVPDVLTANALAKALGVTLAQLWRNRNVGLDIKHGPIH